MRAPSLRQLFGSPDATEPSDRAPVDVICDFVLYRLRVWDEAACEALPDSGRPIFVEHVPGLGWIGAVPVQSLN